MCRVTMPFQSAISMHFLQLQALLRLSGFDSAAASTTALVVSTTLLLVGLVVTYWIHAQRSLDIVVEPISPLPPTETISVCVPARNEERNIAGCVEAILAQTYPDFELIVVDDHSSDGTPGILSRLQTRAGQLRLIQGGDLPPGWAGKPFALHQAASAARGRWLCFIDADTYLAPAALSSCHAKAKETGADLFTIMTNQVTATFWERAVLPLVLTALSVGFPARKVNDPRHPDAIANGQFILIKRSVFDAIGGYERIKPEIAEDKAIAEQVKRNGYRLVIADGRQIARTRMYTSLREMWEGWTKNIYVGLRDQPHLLVLGALGVTLLMLAAFALPLWPLLGVWWFLQGGGEAALAVISEAVLLWVAVLVARAAAAAAMGISRWYALTTPVGAAVFAAMMLTSAWKVLSGRGVTWRGRLYKV